MFSQTTTTPSLGGFGQQPTQAKTGFSFGTPSTQSQTATTAAPTQPQSGGFSFGATPTQQPTSGANPQPQTTGFSFGAAPKSTPATTAAGILGKSVKLMCLM